MGPAVRDTDAADRRFDAERAFRLQARDLRLRSPDLLDALPVVPGPAPDGDLPYEPVAQLGFRAAVDRASPPVLPHAKRLPDQRDRHAHPHDAPVPGIFSGVRGSGGRPGRGRHSHGVMIEASMFKSVLVANRGEIARRVFATARRMGLETIAVYSEADAQAAHVADADPAVLIGPAAAQLSYLVPEKIIAAAKASGAEAIHPGYGFLSENAAFADAVTAAGGVWVRPPRGAVPPPGLQDAPPAPLRKGRGPP